MQAPGPEGRVYAVEVEADLVAALNERVAREGLDNVEVVLGRYEDPLLPEAAIELAITCLTYHHIEARTEYFASLRRYLAAGGRVAHLDDRDDMGLPFRWLANGHWSNVEQMSQEMSAAGYRRVDSFGFLPVQSFQVFAPRATSVGAGS